MENVSSEVVVCAPFPYLSQVEALITHSQIKLGAQNLNLNIKTVNQSPDSYRGWFEPIACPEFYREGGAKHIKPSINAGLFILYVAR